MSIETDQLLGTDLAGYRIESVLGRGGMGVVYLATDLRLERKVALKLVAPELAGDARFRERFLRESRLAASLDHSHIVPVYAAGELDGRLWIAMRYVQGTDLKTLLDREGPIEPARAVKLVSHVGEALDAAHAHGLVHRDVKPANVLVTEEGGEEHCYLADFGLARTAELEAGAGTGAHLSGTVDYTAPEQIAAETADQRADVYSLGCVLYECLTGEPPFKRPRAIATLFAHASEPPPSPHEKRPELPEAIDTVIADALAKNPEERYETCGELCQAAETGLGLGGPHLTRRQFVLAGTGAAIAIAAAAAVPAVLLTRRDRTAAPPPAILPVTEDSVVRIDPATGEAVAAIATGSSPVGVAVGGGAVWLVTTGDKRLSRLDPDTNEIVASVGFPPAVPESPQAIVAGEGAVWTVHANGVLKYDPATATFPPLPDNIELAKDDDDIVEYITFAADVAAGHGAVWVTSADILRLDPETGVMLDRIRPPSDSADPSSAGWLAVGEGGVWHASPLGRVTFIESRANTVAHTARVSEVLDDIAVGEGAVWALNTTDDSILRIDPTTWRVAPPVRVGRLPTAVAAGAGAVWVTNGRDGTLSRIDPTTSDVETIDLGGAGTDVAVGLGGVWVTVDVR
jgi:streptogramin lyase/tRNA A-37 threonylcarbamoyl transferase component Bud32